MNVGKVLMGMGAAVGLLSSTVAMAATTRSAAALPSVQTPMNGLRTLAPLKRKSAQSDEGSSTGTYVVGGLAAAAVIAGIVVVASDNNNNSPSSPG